MRFVIKHEIRGRIRVHVLQKRMTYEQADTLYYYLNRKQNVTSVKVYERSQDVTVRDYKTSETVQLRNNRSTGCISTEFRQTAQ